MADLYLVPFAALATLLLGGWVLIVRRGSARAPAETAGGVGTMHAGLGQVSLYAAATWWAGPSAVFWLVLGTLAGAWLTGDPRARSAGTKGLIAARAWLTTLTALVVAAAIGGGAAVDALRVGVGVPTTAAAIGLALVFLLVARSNGVAARVRGWAPIAALATAALAVATLVTHGDAVPSVLERAVSEVWTRDVLGIGLLGGVLSIQASRAVVWSAVASGAPRGKTALLQAVWAALIALATATQQGAGVPVAEPQARPLTQAHRSGLRPSKQIGQLITLPDDTALEPDKTYDLVLRANPRGHEIGNGSALLADEDVFVMPAWGVAQNVDTLVLPARDPELQKNAGFDVRVPVTREAFEHGGRGFIKLKPKDPDFSLRKTIAQRQLGTPRPVLDDFRFAGHVARGVQHTDEGPKEQRVMFETRAEGDHRNPPLHQFFRMGYAGPFAADEPRRPWAFVATQTQGPESAAKVGSIVSLEMAPPARGAPIARVTQLGALEAPAWDFLADVDIAVVRHESDPRLDLFVPVRGRWVGQRRYFESADPQLPSFRTLAALPDYEGVYLQTAAFRFDAEVRTATRLGNPDGRVLVPIVDGIEPIGRPTDATGGYRPHPAELTAAGFSAPRRAAAGAWSLATTTAAGGALGRALATAVFLLAALVGVAGAVDARTGAGGKPGPWVVCGLALLSGWVEIAPWLVVLTWLWTAALVLWLLSAGAGAAERKAGGNAA